jgi:hypothetical protein
MITREIEQACMASLDRWMIALNAHDVDAMDKELHFPHVRLAEGRLVVLRAARLKSDGPFHFVNSEEQLGS